jgi:PIN domain nuclease of toxin-antitoxin system
MLNLDTNVLLALMEDKLRADEERAMDHDPEWGISAIVFWELTKLWQVGKLKRSPSDAVLNAALRQLAIWPLTHEIGQGILRLDFSSDPADEIIAATSLVHGAPLLTRDDRILRSNITPLAIR